GVRIAAFDAGFRRDVNERLLLRTIGEMAVDRVMAQVGPAAREPARKRRVRAVEHGIEWGMPMNARGFVAPEFVGRFDRTAVEFAVAGHRRRSFGLRGGRGTMERRGGA